MTDFYEYTALSRKLTLPDTHTMLSMAGMRLDVPNEQETRRMLTRDKKRHSAVGRKVHETIVPLDSQPDRTAKKRF